MTFVKRHISLKVELGEGAFGEDGSNTFEISGIRASASIEKTGGVDMTWLSLRAFGLPLEVMNKLTLLGKPLVENRHNTITVSAGDDDSGLAVVFVGVISEAWIDPTNAPQVAFIVSAFSGLIEASKPVPPVSYKGTVDAALVVASIAQQTGLGFENSGVNVQIADPYLSGTSLQQLQKIARAGDFNCVIDDGTVAIWPMDGVRAGQELLISPDTGLIGYPMRTENGVELQLLFNPSVIFGAKIKVESSLTPANGQWTIFRVSHELEAETPQGKWFTTLECSTFGHEVAIG
jgi:hypothetical protein